MEDQTITQPADFNSPKHFIRFTACNSDIQKVALRKRGELPSSPSPVIPAYVRRVCQVRENFMLRIKIASKQREVQPRPC